MDERDSSDVLGIDEDTDVSVDAAEKNHQSVSYAGKVSDVASRKAARASDAPSHAMTYADRISQSEHAHRDSVLDKLHAKQEQVSESKDKPAPAKKREQSL